MSPIVASPIVAPDRSLAKLGAMETKEERPFAPQRDWNAIAHLLEEGKDAIASRSTALDRFRVYAAIFDTVTIARRSVEGQVSTDPLRFAEKMALRQRMNAAFAGVGK